MQSICKTFKELTLNEFYEITTLRIDVFVVEQNCVYHELDGKDQKAHHLFIKDPESAQIIAYTRIFKPGSYFDEAAFGRVVVHPKHRKKHIGRFLVNEVIEFITKNFDLTTIKISAQTHLKEWYESFGFNQISDPYLEDGIPHIDMLKH